MLASGADLIRTSLHILAVTVWVGGQITLLGLLPVLRAAGGDLPAQVARQFNRVAWPAFGVALITGIWNISEMADDRDTSVDVALMFKLIAVAISGVGAWWHSNTTNPAIRGASAAIGAIAALAALVLGVSLSG